MECVVALNSDEPHLISGNDHLNKKAMFAHYYYYN